MSVEARVLQFTPQFPDLGVWEERVRLMVKPRRYEHVRRVAELAQQIALANGLSQLEADLAYEAGILHDIARDLPNTELLRLAPPECEIDALHPLALHGRAARTLLEHWGYRQQVVLEAVEDHTTGPRGGNRVSACVYIADVSEPGRGVNDDIRELALSDLAAALNRAIVSKVTYLQGRGIQVHPRTLSAYDHLCAHYLPAGHGTPSPTDSPTGNTFASDLLPGPDDTSGNTLLVSASQLIPATQPNLSLNGLRPKTIHLNSHNPTTFVAQRFSQRPDDRVARNTMSRHPYV